MVIEVMTFKRNTDVFFGGALLVFALLGLFVAIPNGIVMPSNINSQALGPQFWPKIITISLAIFGGIIFIQGLVQIRHSTFRNQGELKNVNDREIVVLENESGDLPIRLALLRASIAMTGLFAFYFAINILGMIISSSVAIIFYTLLGGERKIKNILPLALLLPTGLYYFFVYAADIPIPLGIFEVLR
jgi:putative tricarboxylic transport membrane protein